MLWGCARWHNGFEVWRDDAEPKRNREREGICGRVNTS
jgi:hypothetical protein